MELTDHARKRMAERNVSADEVHAALAFGKRIGTVYHFRRGPGLVIRVYTTGDRKTRVVTTVVRKEYEPQYGRT